MMASRYGRRSSGQIADSDLPVISGRDEEKKDVEPKKAEFKRPERMVPFDGKLDRDFGHSFFLSGSACVMHGLSSHVIQNNYMRHSEIQGLTTTTSFCRSKNASGPPRAWRRTWNCADRPGTSNGAGTSRAFRKDAGG